MHFLIPCGIIRIIFMIRSIPKIIMSSLRFFKNINKPWQRRRRLHNFILIPELFLLLFQIDHCLGFGKVGIVAFITEFRILWHPVFHASGFLDGAGKVVDSILIPRHVALISRISRRIVHSRSIIVGLPWPILCWVISVRRGVLWLLLPIVMSYQRLRLHCIRCY